jgi:hypothetical protein
MNRETRRLGDRETGRPGEGLKMVDMAVGGQVNWQPTSLDWHHRNCVACLALLEQELTQRRKARQGMLQRFLVPRLSLGTNCVRGSASCHQNRRQDYDSARGACRVRRGGRCEAEPRNEAECRQREELSRGCVWRAGRRQPPDPWSRRRGCSTTEWNLGGAADVQRSHETRFAVA